VLPLDASRAAHVVDAPAVKPAEAWRASIPDAVLTYVSVAGTRAAQSSSAARRLRAATCGSVPAILATTMPTQDTYSEPDESSQQRGTECEQPYGPREIPHEKAHPDVFSILNHEEGKDAKPGQRRDGAAAEPSAISVSWFHLAHRHCMLLTVSRRMKQSA
jgi:hypothetical protein